MPELKYKTKGNSSPRDKRRVYFTCHPEDFNLYFEKICGDIFKTHDCVVYYTENLTEAYSDDELATDLGSHSLFVIPVTYKLLTEPSRAMSQDIPYAKAYSRPPLHDGGGA